MSARDLIEQFQAEGALERRGEFQVDRDKAREKMQKFQLPDPHAYVLELVKFATILGATRIRFEIDADEMRMETDCDALTVEDLENLYGAAFSRLKSNRQRALRHLAIGLTAADALNPSIVQIRSTDSEGGGRYEAKNGEETIAELEPGARHTEIYLREKFKAGHLVEFFSSIAGSLAEHHHLLERCRYSSVDITLGTQQVSHGISSDAHYQRVIDSPQERGLMWLLDPSVVDSKVEILQSGVLISTYYFAGDGAPFHAVVESSRLTTDLTQSAFVEDAAFRQLTRVLLVRIHDQLLTQKFMELPVQEWGKHHRTVENLAAEIVRIVGRAKSLDISTQESRMKLAEKLEEYPILPLASSPEPLRGRFHTPRLAENHLVPIAAVRGLPGLYISFRRLPTVELPDKPVVLLAGREGGSSIGALKVNELARYLGVESIDVTGELQNRSEWDANRRKWEHQQWPTELKSEIFPVQLEFVDGELTCRMGIRTGPPLPSSVAWVLGGRLLKQESLGSGHFPWLSFLFVGEIEPNIRFDGPARSEANYSIALRAIVKVPELMERLALAGAERGLTVAPQLLRYLEALAKNDLHPALSKAMSVDGSDDRIFEELASRSGHWSFGPRDTADAFLEAVRGLGAVGEAKIFETLDGSTASLLDLAEAYVDRGSIFVVHERHRGEGLEDAYHVARQQTGLTIWSDNDLDSFLYRLIGGDAQSARKRIIFQAAKVRFLERPALDLVLPRNRYLSSVEVEDEAARIKVGLVPVVRPEDGVVKLNVRYEQRLVEQAMTEVPLGEFDVVVNATGVYPNTSFDALEEGAPKFELWSRIKGHCRSVLYSWVRHYGSTYEQPGDLGSDEEIFWAYFHELYRREPDQWLEIVVARDENGNQITAREISTLVRYGKLAFVREGLEIVEELVPGPGHIPVITLRSGVQVSELVLDSIELVDVSKTRENIEFLEAAEDRFMQKSVASQQITGPVVVKVPIETDVFDGSLALLSSTNESENRQLEVDLHYRKRFVQTRRILAPFGTFKAIVEGKNFELDGTWTSVEKGHRAVWPVVREAAANAIVELCHLWEREPHILHAKRRGLILHLLSHAARDRENIQPSWQKVLERLETTKIFRMADRSWRDFRYLTTLQKEYGGPRWLNDHNLATDSWQGVEPSTVVIIENGVEDAIAQLPMFNWNHAKDVAGRRDAPAASAESEAPGQILEGSRVPEEALEGVRPDGPEPEMHALAVSLGEVLRSVRKEQHVLLGDGVIARIEIDALDDPEIVRVSSTGLVLNETHPVVKHVLEHPDDPVALSFLGSSVYTAINVFYREITDDHELEFQSLYANWMRSVLNL